MTKAQFIAAVEAKSNFIKWADAPKVAEKIGVIEKHHGLAYITTPDGTNTFNIWFMVDTETGEATWQQHNTLAVEENENNKKLIALREYLASNFAAFFIEMDKLDLDNNWAVASVYSVSGQDLAERRVLVFKQGNNPVTHRTIV